MKKHYHTLNKNKDKEDINLNLMELDSLASEYKGTRNQHNFLVYIECNYILLS